MMCVCAIRMTVKNKIEIKKGKKGQAVSFRE